MSYFTANVMVKSFQTVFSTYTQEKMCKNVDKSFNSEFSKNCVDKFLKLFHLLTTYAHNHYTINSINNMMLSIIKTSLYSNTQPLILLLKK
jgi:hypothetical protein